ncbi:MAG TPA: hypothetical protein VGD77_10455 [Gemmatimonadaceae bacterium]
MNGHLRDRILRKIETLSDERGYQVLDYVEFLEARYAEKPVAEAGIFVRLSDAVEDKLRAGRVSVQAIGEVTSLLDRAGKLLDGVAAAGRSLSDDIQGKRGPTP